MPQYAFLFFTGHFKILSQQSQRPEPFILTLILPRSRTGTVWFYTSTSNKRAARPKLYTVINKGLKSYV